MTRYKESSCWLAPKLYNPSSVNTDLLAATLCCDCSDNVRSKNKYTKRSGNTLLRLVYLFLERTLSTYLYKEWTVLFIQGDEKKRGKITFQAKIWVDISIVLAPNKVMEEKKLT